MEKLTNPNFLFAEILPKTGNEIQDNRQFIYCPPWLSLIEVVPLDAFTAAWPKEQPQKEYQHGNEEFLLVITQNNIEQVNAMREVEYLQKGLDKMTAETLLDQAWNYYQSYLTWEDEQI